MSKYAVRMLLMLAALVAVLAVAACGGDDPTPTSTPTAPPETTPTASKAAWEIEWEETLAAAKQEGELTYILGGSGVSPYVPGFQAAFPEINFEGVELRSPGEVNIRVPQEREAGQFLWDIYFQGGSLGVTEFGPKPAGIDILQDLRSLFIFPELSDDDTWVGRLDDMWVDSETRKYKMHMKAGAILGPSFDVNRDEVSEESLSSLDDFFKPEFKGKICVYDPRIEGGSDSSFAQIAMMYGDDYLDRLFRETEMTISRDRRALAEDLIRGTCVIGIGSDIRGFKREGLGLHVRSLTVGRDTLAPEWKDLVSVTCCGGGDRSGALDGWLGGGANNTMLMVATQNPHPNATKVFVNWVLSQEGSKAWQLDNEANACSRRADLHSTFCVDFLRENGDFVPLKENGTYLSLHSTKNLSYRYASHDVAFEVWGR